jgi:diamine N-acetyltransferase
MSEFDLEVTLREITKENWRDILRLKVAPHQEQFVASSAMSIAEAHFNPEVAWFRAIYAGDVPVGFLMLEDDVVQQEYFLWRFMIGEQYQGRGYGRKALELFFAHVKTRPGADAVETSLCASQRWSRHVLREDGFCVHWKRRGRRTCDAT